MQTLQMFYKKYGVRSLMQLREARIVSASSIVFPFKSTIVSFAEDSLHGGFPVSQFDISFYVHNILELTSLVNTPIVQPFKISTLRQHVADSDGLLLLKPINDESSKRPILVNGSALIHRYKYKHNLTATVDRILNYFTTIVDTVAALNDEREIILTIPVEGEIPEAMWFKLAVTKPKLWLASHSLTDHSVIWLELYKYFMNTASVFTPLRDKPLTFILYSGDRAVVLHNALFDLLQDVNEKDLSGGLTYNIPKITPATGIKLLPSLLQDLIDQTVVTDSNVEETSQSLNGAGVGVVTPVSTQIVEQANNDKVILAHIKVAAASPNPLTKAPIGTPPPPPKLHIPPRVVSNVPTDPAYQDISTVDMDTQYIKSGLYAHDMSNAILGIQAAGIIVTGIEREVSEDVLGDIEILKVHVRGLDGNRSTLSMSLPIINQDGSYTVDGTDYRLRKQRVEPPIIKTAPNRVVLNSYFGTLFVTRSPKATDDIGRFLSSQINKLAAADPSVAVLPRNVFDSDVSTPQYYGKLAQYYKQITLPNYVLTFDYHRRTEIPGYNVALETDGLVCGTYKGKPLVMKYDNDIYLDGDILGSIASILGIPDSKIPDEYAQIKILGVEIPVGVFLGSRVGITHLLDKGTDWVFSDKRSDPASILTLKFKDRYVHIHHFVHKEYELILNSMLKMSDLFKDYPYSDFDYSDVYQLWVEQQGLAIRYFNEFEIIDKLFIDDVSTRELLHKMGEPAEFKALLIRACQMLTVETHSRPNDGKLLRFRGNERFAGFVYKALTVSVRGYKNTTNVNKRRMELAPWEVFNLVTGDNSSKPVEDNNPIQFVKERETITLAGQGGRSGQTLTTDNRTFDKNDMGFIGEAGTDNGDVGMVTFLSAAPLIEDLRGRNASTLTDATQNPVNVYTTSYMLAPGATKDHMPRVSFINIQNTHNIQMDGIETPYVRTGYEYAFAFKAGKHYAWMAAKDGEVVGIADGKISVKYVDGTVENGPLGIIAGRSGDKYYPHMVVTSLVKGAKFKVDDHISYNQAFFKPDDLYPTKLCYTHSRFVDTAIIDDLYTYEDSCAVSDTIAPDLTTQKLSFKRVVLQLDSDISQVLKVGDKVAPDTPLMVITDAIGTYSSPGTSDSLKDLLANVPKAGTKGTVVNIEAYYYGEEDEMSNSVKALVKITDTTLKASREANNKSIVTGKITRGHRINGKPMNPGFIEVRFFILASNGVSRGDKFVFGNQLKATAGAVFKGTRRTTSGITYDATFGYRGALARIVQSTQDVGAYSRFMEFLGKYLANKL